MPFDPISHHKSAALRGDSTAYEIDFVDTFVSAEHAVASFPDVDIKVGPAEGGFHDSRSRFRIAFNGKSDDSERASATVVP